MGSWTLPRGPATGFLVLLWLSTFFWGLVLVASDGDSKATDPKEKQALLDFKAALDDPNGNLKSWVENSDPCRDGWNWVVCNSEDENYRHVTALRLLNLALGGQLTDSLANLPALSSLDVMWNHLNGSIPAAIGRLDNLVFLLLSGNQFSGALPPELGSLTKLQRLQIDENRFSGQIPSTFSNLTAIRHLHMNNNTLTGSVPSGLGRLPNLLHVLLDNNDLTGTLPDDLANAPNLIIIQLDNNQFTGVPAAYTRIPRLQKLSMRNCSLGGSLPNFNESTSLAVLDLSRNSLTGSLPTFALPVNITSVALSHNNLQGAVSSNFGNLQNLGYLELRNNNLSGEIAANLGLGRSFNDSGRVVLDFQNNSLVLAGNVLSTISQEPGHQVQVWLSGNPVACPPNSESSNPFCVPHTIDSYLTLDVPQTSDGQSNSECPPCSSPEQRMPAPVSTPDTCGCAIPITIWYRLKSPPFAIFDTYETAFKQSLADELELSVDQIGINSTEYEMGPRIKLGIFIFPTKSGETFNQTEVDRITGAFYNWDIAENAEFGPYELINIIPPASSSSGSNGLSAGAIVGIVCASVLASAILGALLMFCWLRRRGSGRVFGKSKRQTTINVPGVRSFSFAEMVKATSNFRDENLLGRGGYGNVYFGTLEDGQKVAVKRAEEGSFQGAKEFENEIQLLSRVHHRNLVALVGYCNDDGEHINGEQMLVYEFVPNGNLREHLIAGGPSALDIMSRLRIAIGAARGIQYLHTQADPPIFHRDIKAPNILVDAKYDAKVSDFGLSKLAMTDADIEGVNTGHVTTVVKGTPGYLDPEYFLTHKLTDKSDVYSFGVVLLELISGLPPIVNGKNLTREVNSAYREGDVMRIIDPRMGPYSMDTIEPLIKLALSCVDNDTSRRPSMTDVLHELEEIWKEAPWSDASHSQLGEDSRDLRGEPGEPRNFPNSRNASSLNPSRPGLYDSSIIGDEENLMSRTTMNVLPR